jgi:hypothetical protein
MAYAERVVTLIDGKVEKDERKTSKADETGG